MSGLLWLCLLATLFSISLSAEQSERRTWYRPQPRVNPFTLSGQALVNHINRNGEWKAQYNHKLGDAKPTEISRLAGVKADFPRVLLRDVNKTPRLLAKTKTKNKTYSNIKIPREFDARKHWPHCADVIGDIQDQSLCGSCWIVSAASSFADRLCIYTLGRKKPQISSMDGLSCCTNCGEGCIGGYPHRAFEYMQYKGIVSGGNYTNKVGCKPYIFPPCTKGESKRKTTFSQCDGKLFTEPACIKTCREGFNHNYYTDRFFASDTAAFIRDPEAVQRELLMHGPLVFSALRIYEDFLYYKSGVYKVSGGRFIGLHALKVIGWGEELGTPYWLLANSWGRQYGDKGYVKVRRGNNEANLEGMANSGYVDLPRSASAFKHL